MIPTEAAKEVVVPTPQISPQSIGIWNIHTYAIPSSNGTGLLAAAGKTLEICEKVIFHGTYFGAIPMSFEGGYDANQERYVGFVSDFFPAGTGTQVVEFGAACALSNGGGLVTNPINLYRYYVPCNSSTTVTSGDNLVELTLFTTSLSTSQYVIVMTTNALPDALPAGVKRVGEPYSLRASDAILESDGNMGLSLRYSDVLLGDADPLTLRVFEWDDTSETWSDTGDQSNLESPDPRLSKATRKFTTYVLGSTPLWFDTFTDGRGLDTMDNITRTTAAGGKLKLDITSAPGIAISKPYTPTMKLEGWKAISYTANVPPGASLSVSVLGENSTLLRSNATSGQNLADIDPALHPSLRLRVNMSTTSGTSPELLDWSILAELSAYKIYLPVILRD